MQSISEITTYAGALQMIQLLDASNLRKSNVDKYALERAKYMLLAQELHPNHELPDFQGEEVEKILVAPAAPTPIVTIKPKSNSKRRLVEQQQQKACVAR